MMQIRYFTRGEIIDLDDPYRGANYNEEAANVLREMPQPLPDLLEQLQVFISAWIFSKLHSDRIYLWFRREYRYGKLN